MLKQRLFTPGPTDVPPEVLVEMAKPMFHHRTRPSKSSLPRPTMASRSCCVPKNDVLTLAGSGTAAMEAAIACAARATRPCWCQQRQVRRALGQGRCKAYGIDVEDMPVEWGTGAPAEVMASHGHQGIGLADDRADGLQIGGGGGGGFAMHDDHHARSLAGGQLGGQLWRP